MVSDISLHMFNLLFPHMKMGLDFYLLLRLTPVTVTAWHIASLNTFINQFPRRNKGVIYVTVYPARSCAMHGSNAASLLKELITFGENTF